MDLATTTVSTHSQEEMHDQDTLPLVRDTSQVWVLLRTIPTGFSVTSTVWLGTLPLSKRVTENELGAIIVTMKNTSNFHQLLMFCDQ